MHRVILIELMYVKRPVCNLALKSPDGWPFGLCMGMHATGASWASSSVLRRACQGYTSSVATHDWQVKEKYLKNMLVLYRTPSREMPGQEPNELWTAVISVWGARCAT